MIFVAASSARFSSCRNRAGHEELRVLSWPFRLRIHPACGGVLGRCSSAGFGSRWQCNACPSIVLLGSPVVRAWLTRRSRPGRLD